MDDLKKLRHLIHHWKVHNNEHGDTYRKWAERIESAGNKDLAEALRCLYEKTKELDACFKRAEEVASSLSPMD